jgi:hypothetical protein
LLSLWQDIVAFGLINNMHLPVEHRRIPFISSSLFLTTILKDQLGDQRGESEWEPIKILLEVD